MITVNCAASLPARTTESTTETYGTCHVSKTQRVHPSSMEASYERYSPMRRPGGPAHRAVPLVRRFHRRGMDALGLRHVARTVRPRRGLRGEIGSRCSTGSVGTGA